MQLPAGFAHGDGWTRRVRLRPWTSQDADRLDRSQLALPAARVSELLGFCCSLEGEASCAGPEFARRLTSGDRQALLLHLRRLVKGERIECVTKCPECGETMELELEVSDLLLSDYGHHAQEHETIVEVDGVDRRLIFRLVNGGDEEAAATLVAKDVEAAVRLVIERCAVSLDGALPERWPEDVARKLPAVLAELDPQAELELRARCPACSEPVARVLDAAELVFAAIAEERDRVDREVHALALAYHWSEAEIRAMSPTRRSRYLDLLAESTEALR